MSNKDKTVLDTHNIVSAKQFHTILTTSIKKIIEDPSMAKLLPPTMCWGSPGCGKSSIVKRVADELGIGFIDFRLSQREPVDLKGLPVPNKETNTVDWFPTSDLPSDKDSKGILLFDEITAADRSLQVAAYELILDRRLGKTYSLPDGWYIVACGNKTTDRAVSTTMSSALANRFLHVELTANLEDWTMWAQKNDIHPSVIGYLNYRPAVLFNMDDENLERGWPSPRSWERVSQMIYTFGSGDEVLLRKIIYGLVGNHAGVEFMEFFKNSIQFDSVLEMMTNPKAEIKIPQKLDQIYAFCSAVSYLVWRGKDPADEANRLNGFYRIGCKLTSDFACMTMIAAMNGNKDHDSAECCEKIFYHPLHKEWTQLHSAAMKKRYQFN